MIGTPEQDGFIKTSNWGIVKSRRPYRAPARSLVYFYCSEGDQLTFGTTSREFQESLRNDPRVALTVLDEATLFSGLGYVTIEGKARIQWNRLLDGYDRLREIELHGERTVIRCYVNPFAVERRIADSGFVLIHVTAEHVHGVLTPA